jgi:WD40 repeat protein
MPAAVQRLWYAYAPDSVSSPILQVEQIDSSAQRWGKGPITVDLGLRTGFPGPSVYALFPSPDSKWIAAQLGYGETAFLYVIRLDTGKTTQILPKSTFAGFIAWKSDSQNIFVHDSNTDYKSVAEVDIETGAYQHIDFPKLDGDTPDIDAIVYSPDGSLMADALAYQPKNGGRSECLLSIGITDIKSQERKTIQEIPSACSAGNLQWSPDGHYLSWIVGKNIIDTTLHTSSSQYELWVSDRTRGDTKSIYLIGVNPSRIVSPTWSPDGKNIAFVKFDDKQMRNPDGNIILIDPVNGPQAQISHFSGLSLSSLQWSSDGKLIFCNAFNDQYGTIWAINIENGDTFPVAGPVSPESPLAIAP